MSANFTPINIPHSHKRQALLIGLGVASIVIVFVAGILAFSKPQTSLTRADFVNYQCQEGQYVSDAKTCLSQGGAVANSIGVGDSPTGGSSQDTSNVFVCCKQATPNVPQEPGGGKQSPFEQDCSKTPVEILSVDVTCDKCAPNASN